MSSVEKLEYSDQIVYYHDSTLILSDSLTNEAKSTHALHENSHYHWTMIGSVERHWSRVVSIGIGEVLFAYTYRNEKYWSYLVFMHPDWKTYKSTWTEECTYPTNLPDMKVLLPQKLQEIKENKYNWLTDSQVKQLKQFSEKEIFSIISKTDEQCFMKINNKIVVITSESPDDKIVFVTYCKYDKMIFVHLKGPDKLKFQRWEEDNNSWILKKRVAIDTSYFLVWRLSRIYSMECSKKAIFLGIVDRKGDNKVVVLDKYTLTECYWTPGSHPTFHDNYELWFTKNLEILKDIEAINKIAEAILCIILSYVD